MSQEDKIRARLIAVGRKLFNESALPVRFTGNGDADRVLNDIRRKPHLFVLGCVVDRQVKTEKAWMIPIHLSEAAGGMEFDRFERLEPRSIERVLMGPPALHRFPRAMAPSLHSAVQRIRTSYGGVASRIWAGRPSSAEVVYRFLEFDGVGPKIATMAANILARYFKIPFADLYSIDISADAHVRRVFARLHLVPEDASMEQVIYRARGLHAEFPGLLDLAPYRAGRSWCRPTHPLCGSCFLREVCPTAVGVAQ